MTADEARRQLIEQIAPLLHGYIAPQLAEGVVNDMLAVVEQATATCETCGGGGRLYDSDNQGADLSGIYDIGPCNCGGNPGPLLILLALGGTQGHDACHELWRFPRQQDNTTTTEAIATPGGG